LTATPPLASPPWRPSSRLAGAILLLLLLGGLLYALRSLLLPILLALLLAYMLAPLVRLLERRARIPHAAGALIVFLVLALLLAGAATVFLPIWGPAGAIAAKFLARAAGAGVLLIMLARRWSRLSDGRSPEPEHSDALHE